jgi:hypothetical protein
MASGGDDLVVAGGGDDHDVGRLTHMHKCILYQLCQLVDLGLGGTIQIFARPRDAQREATVDHQRHAAAGSIGQC